MKTAMPITKVRVIVNKIDAAIKSIESMINNQPVDYYGLTKVYDDEWDLWKEEHKKLHLVLANILKAYGMSR